MAVRAGIRFLHGQAVRANFGEGNVRQCIQKNFHCMWGVRFLHGEAVLADLRKIVHLSMLKISTLAVGAGITFSTAAQT